VNRVAQEFGISDCGTGNQFDCGFAVSLAESLWLSVRSPKPLRLCRRGEASKQTQLDIGKPEAFRKGGGKAAETTQE